MFYARPVRDLCILPASHSSAMTDAERIRTLLEYTRMNGKNFARRIGLSYPDSIYHILRGRNGISDKLADRIAMTFPQIDKGWLLTGEGSMFRPERHREQVWNTLPGLAGECRLPQQQVPLYDFEAVAGLVPIFTNQNTPIDYISIPDLPRCDGAVYVRGDSMYPLLKAGDIVMYKQIQDYYNIIWGEMYLISFNYEGEEYITVKFIKKVEDRPDTVLLVSHNPHHAPKEIPVTAIRALAMVKASIRFNTMG